MFITRFCVYVLEYCIINGGYKIKWHFICDLIYRCECVEIFMYMLK